MTRLIRRAVGKDISSIFPQPHVEERFADSKGRVYLGKWYANKKLYMVDLGGYIVLTPYSDFARELEGKSREEIEKLLSSVTPEEVREAFKGAAVKRVEGAVNG